MSARKNFPHHFILNDSDFINQLKIVFDYRFYYYNLRDNNICLEQKSSAEALFDHYLSFGMFYNIDCSLMFDSLYYLSKYHDVRDAGYPAIYHFLKYGAYEQRKPIDFFDYNVLASQIDYDFSKNNILIDMYSTLLDVDLSPTILFDVNQLAQNDMFVSKRNAIQKNIFLSYLYNTSMWIFNTHKMIDARYIQKQYCKTLRVVSSSICLPPLLLYFKFPKTIRPHPKFDTIFYAKNYPVEDGVDPLTSFVKFGFSQKQCPSIDVNTEAITRLPGIRNELDYFSYLSSNKETFYTFIDDSASNRILYSVLKNKFSESDLTSSIKYIFVLPFFIRGGSEKVISSYISVLTDFVSPGNILIVTTEKDNHIAKDWLHPGVHILDISFINSQSRVDCLFRLLKFYSPEHVHICNSDTGWSCVETYGEILKEQFILTGNFFAFQFNEKSEVTGFIFKYFKKVTPFLHAILTDNNRVIKDMYGYFPALSSNSSLQIKKIHQPVAVLPKEKLPANTTEKFKILWTGRLAKEKLIDTVYSIARMLSDFEFHIFGENYDLNPDGLSRNSLKNIIYRGSYLSFSDIIANEHFDCFLFTSKWEGLPNVLLEAMSCQLPIVASCVGGVQEVICDEVTGLLVFNVPNSNEYAEKISRLANDPDLCKKLGGNAQAFVQEHHNFQVFYEDVVCSLLCSNVAREQQFSDIPHRANPDC